MIAGMSGTLLSHEAVERLLATGQEPVLSPEQWSDEQRRLRKWYAGILQTLGPAVGPRTVFDRVAAPLAEAFGFSVLPVPGGSDTVDGELRQQGSLAAVLIAAAWGRPPRTLWRHAVQRGLAHGVRWAIGINGLSLSVFDAERAYARRFLEFDLAAAFGSDRSLAVLRGLTGADGLRASPDGSPIERAMAHTERHRAMVRLSLRRGVHQAVLELVSGFRAVSGGHRSGHADEALTVVYRVLFLLFAEARNLVPAWHPVYRDSYSIGSVRAEIGRGRPRGLWQTLQAVARLAHRGCTAGALKVPPFNGRLFSPLHAPLAARARLDDLVVLSALRALTTREADGRREDIAYADLGVEQLGGVYEHLLDFDFSTADPGNMTSGRAQRKATGTFYTPRPLTEFIVRRTLGPAVEGRTPEEILALRVLDPAMGSGAFLVAACRYLAAAYEAALIREGAVIAADLTDGDRADFRRAVAQRCLYGVDVNPMAVQLARLSLWLATLAAAKPLTFLDHRLRVGHSLIGASLDDLVREPAVRARRRSELPLFGEEDGVQRTLCAAVGARLQLAAVPDDTLDQVRAKERACSSLDGHEGPLERWRAAADLWCAAFLGERPGDKSFPALRDHVVRGAGPLPEHVAAPLVAGGRAAAAAARVFHWSLEFPEIFYDERGLPLTDAGFDVVLGNPPWEMLRGEGDSRAGVMAFAKGSGHYRLQGDGHTNLYQLFFERGLGLLKRHARCGLILPAGFAGDHGSGVLRRHLFEHAHVETFTTIDNRGGIFPIHRGLRFLLLTFRTPGKTVEVPLRSGVGSTEALERVPDTGADPGTLGLSRALLERVSGESLAVPEVRAELDLRILTAVTASVPAVSASDGWAARFGRELNATDDRPHFTARSGMPVIEGKQVNAFRVAAEEARFRIAPDEAGRLLEPERTFHRRRLAYRDVAAAGNRMTLIAAIIPAGVVTTHTLFCLKTPLEDEAQAFLCGVLNSYVANFLIRMRVGTHVTTAIVSRLPVPKPSRLDRRFMRVAACAHSLTLERDERVVAELNGLVASLYGLKTKEFEHVLRTFPLVPAAERDAALRAFVDQEGAGTGYHSCFSDT